MKKQTGSVAGYRLSVFGHRWGLSTVLRPLFTVYCSLLTVLLLAGTAQAAVNEWKTNGVSTNMSAAANWSLGAVPTSIDVARWNYPGYTYQPSLTNAMTIGQLLFDTNNTAGVTIGGDQALTLNRLEGVGIQMTNGSGAVTINAPVWIGNSLSFVNNNPSGGGNVLTFGGNVGINNLGLTRRLTVAGSGDITINGTFGPYATCPLTMNGAGTLKLGGSGTSVSFTTIANSGTMLLDKSAGIAIPSTLTIGQANTTPALVKYTGASANMIADAAAVNIYGAGQLDMNGKSDTIGALTILSAGASGDSTALTNSTPGSGTLTITTPTIHPRLGYKTTVNTGAGGTLAISGNISTYPAGNGWAQISGKLDLGSAAERQFNPYVTIREATNDLVIDAAISGTRVPNAIFLGQLGRVVLAGSNTFSGTVGLYTDSILNIQNGNALGSPADWTGAYLATAYGTLELQPATGSMVVAEPLMLIGEGGNTRKYGYVGALRNISGTNTLGGTVTLLGTTRINSDGGLLTLTNTIGGNFGLIMGGLGDVTVSGDINTVNITVSTYGLYKDGAGTLTLAGTNLQTGATSVGGGKLALELSSGSTSKSWLQASSLYLGKGSIELRGGTQTELFAGTILSQLNPNVCPGGAYTVTRSGGSSSKLRLNTLTYLAPFTIDFPADGIADTDTGNYTGSAWLGAYATVGSNTWAVSATTAADTPITGLPTGSYMPNTTYMPNNTITSNLDMSAGIDTVVTNTGSPFWTAINSIRFNNPSPRTIGIASGQSLRFINGGGGILNTANVGANDNSITNGSIFADSTATPIIIHQYNTNGTLTITADIKTTSLIKTGPGKLILGGAVANTMGAGVWVNDGELDLEKSGSAQAVNGALPLTINQRGIVKYTGTSTDMIGTGAININEAGQLDFNGKSDTLGGALTIVAGITEGGAGGNTTPITNSASGGNLTWGSTWSITPLSGYETLIYSGTGTNTLGGNVTFTAAGSGVVRISGNLGLGSVAPTFTVNEGEALNDMVIDAVISGSNTLTKAGAGRLVLGGVNTYTNTTTINAGILTVTNNSALGEVAGGTTVGNGYTLELQGGITVAAETLSLNNTGVFGGVGALRNVSGDNTWGGPITLAAAARINSDTNTLTLNSGTEMNMAALGLTVGGAGNVIISSGMGPISAGSLTKDGAGTLTLSGANRFTGGTTVNGGTLVLDYASGQDNSKLSETATTGVLTLSKGTLTLNGGTHLELVYSTTLNAGSFAITRSGVSSAVLRMNTITRNVGSTIDFGAGSIADCDNPNTAGILGAGYATVAGTDWASNSLNGADGPIVAYAGYQANSAGTTASISPNDANNVDMSAGNTVLTNADIVNSLRFNTAGAMTLTISNIALTVTSGGILNTANVGVNTSTINSYGAGTISAGIADLKIHQYNTGDLTIDAIVGGTGGLTKTGPGKLILGGTSANSQNAMTYVNGGTLELNKSGAVNAIANGGLTINQTGMVTYTGSSTDMIGTGAITINENGQLDFNGKTDSLGGTLTINSTGASGNTTPIKNSGSGGNLIWGSTWSITPLTGFETLINSGTGTNTLGSTVTFTAAGSGVARISGNLNLGATTPTFTVNDGEAFNDMVVDALISGNAGVGLTKAGAGRLVLSGNNNYTGLTTVSAGALNIQNANALGTTDNGTTVAATTLELQGGITVVGEPLTLGPSAGCTLRNISGNNTWTGPITVTYADASFVSDAGLLTISGDVTGPGTSTGMSIGGAGDMTFNGAVDVQYTFRKLGTGTLTLSGGIKKMRVPAVMITNGKLVLDYTGDGGDTPKLTSTQPTLTLAKCTVDLTGTGSATQAVGIVTLNAGQTAITRSSGSSVLRMNQIVRNVGSTLNFAADGIADTDSVNVNGILASTAGEVFATVGSNTWARSADSGSDIPITGLPDSGYVTNTPTSLGASTSNCDFRAMDTVLPNSAVSINSIRFNDSTGGRTLTLTNSLACYNILVTPNVGSADTVITNTGSLGLTTAIATSITIHQYNTNGALILYAPVNMNGVSYFVKSGPGKLVLGGTIANTTCNGVYVNGGTLELNKTANVNAIPGASPVTINQNGIVKYTGSSSDMIGDTCPITINENGQLDFNGKSDTISTVAITSTGASGNTTPIKNTIGGGNLIMGALSITPLTGPPMAGYRTLIDSGTGTNTLKGDVTFTAAGSGWAQISGNLSLSNRTCTFSVADGDILNELVVDAAIVGGGANGALTKSGTGRLVLGGSNNYDGVTTISGGMLQITNANALGTTVGQTTVGSGFTLELLGNIAVGGEPLTLSGNGMTVGFYPVGALRNFSGDNTWGGPVNLGLASRINSDSGTLTLTNTLSLTTFGLTVGGYGNVTLSGVISGTTGTLTKDGLGMLTLSGASANTFTNLTTVKEGTLVLAKTAVAVSNLTVTGSDTYNGAYGLVRYAANSANNQINGTVTLNANAQGAGQLDFNGSTDTLAVVTINSANAVADSRPIVNTGSGGQLTINALNITPVAEYITKLDSGTNGVLRLGGDVTFTNATTGQATISGILDLNGATRTFNVGVGTAGTGPIYDLGISAVITNGSLTKTGTGRLSLSGVNTYAGDTLVNAGTLVLENANALVATATLSLVSSNGVFPKVNLNFSGTQTVGSLRFDGVLQASGTWGSSSSSAANKNDNWFQGTGVLNVGGKANIVNMPVSGITASGAAFNGQLISAGLSATAVGVLWGTTDGGLYNAWASTNWFDGTWPDGTSFSTNIGLSSGNTYYYTYVASNAEGVVRAGPSVSFFFTTSGANLYWKGLNTNWTDVSNWTNSVGANPAQPPTPSDDVFINVTAGLSHPTLNLSSGPITIKSLTLGTSLASTQTVANGDVLTRLLRVEGDVTIGTAGVLTHAAETATGTGAGSELQRLRFDVGGNMTIAAGGKINVDSKGYGYGKGPGVSGMGGGHGGMGNPDNNGPRGASGITYGSITNPVNAGSGAALAAGGSGGGVVVLRVTGAMTHNGAISAAGGTGSQGGGGAGGSINITAGSIAGTTGSIRANGGNDGNANYGCGGGGRIALWIGSGGIPVSVLTNVTAYPGTSTRRAAAGTIYVNTNATGYGSLIVDNGGVAPYSALDTTLIRDTTYRFDTITVTNNGVFAVGANAALTLDGCTLLTSETTTNNVSLSTRPARLVVQDNGQLNWTGIYTNNGCISWRGTNRTSGLSVGSLTIGSGGILTHETADRPTNCLTLAVNGDLAVDSGGAIWLRGNGYALNNQPSGIGYSGSQRFGGAHGGEGGSGDNGGQTKAPTTPTFGSVTNPVTAGGGGMVLGYEGGGVAILRVAGTVNVNGVIDANGAGPGNSSGGGAGGSVNIQAGVLAGGGSISANGAAAGGINAGGGGGGRVAVVLTNSATFANVAISAAGGINANGGADATASAGAAGTVYLKGTNQAYGLLIVSNSAAATLDASGKTNITTTISTQVTDAVVGDVQILSLAKFSIATNCTLAVYGNWSNATTGVGGTNLYGQGTVVLAGSDPATVWGSNTWYNLTITNAGKVVYFETNKVQTILGTPSWSNNVTLTALNPTSTNTMWKLQKGSSGTTQDVGVVRVAYSDANGGKTFKGAAGSTRLVKNSTQNWVLADPPPAGTVFLFR